MCYMFNIVLLESNKELLKQPHMCAGATKETSVWIFISKKIRFYKAVQNFRKKFLHEFA